VERVEVYLFYGRDLRWVLPRRTCDRQTGDAVSSRMHYPVWISSYKQPDYDFVFHKVVWRQYQGEVGKTIVIYVRYLRDMLRAEIYY